MSLEESLKIFDEVGEVLNSMRGRQQFSQEYNEVVAKNKGLAKFKQISNILVLGKSTSPDEYVDSLSPQETIAFKFA